MGHARGARDGYSDVPPVVVFVALIVLVCVPLVFAPGPEVRPAIDAEVQVGNWSGAFAVASLVICVAEAIVQGEGSVTQCAARLYISSTPLTFALKTMFEPAHVSW
jgi:hypothetical protein